MSRPGRRRASIGPGRPGTRRRRTCCRCSPRSRRCGPGPREAGSIVGDAVADHMGDAAGQDPFGEVRVVGEDAVAVADREDRRDDLEARAGRGRLHPVGVPEVALVHPVEDLELVVGQHDRRVAALRGPLEQREAGDRRSRRRAGWCCNRPSVRGTGDLPARAAATVAVSEAQARGPPARAEPRRRARSGSRSIIASLSNTTGDVSLGALVFGVGEQQVGGAELGEDAGAVPVGGRRSRRASGRRSCR